MKRSSVGAIADRSTLELYGNIRSDVDAYITFGRDRRLCRDKTSAALSVDYSLDKVCQHTDDFSRDVRVAITSQPKQQFHRLRK